MIENLYKLTKFLKISDKIKRASTNYTVVEALFR